MDPFKIFIAVICALLTAILVSLLFAAAMAGDWLTTITGGIGTAATIGLAVETLRSCPLSTPYPSGRVFVLTGRNNID